MSSARCLCILLLLPAFAILSAHSPLAAGEDTADKEKPVELDGSYKCAGTSDGGGKYEGTVEITKVGDAYRLEWVVGGMKHAGIGIFDKDKGLLSTSWASAVEGGVITGVAVYTVEKDKLTGRWAAFPGEGKIYDEVLTRVY